MAWAWAPKTSEGADVTRRAPGAEARRLGLPLRSAIALALATALLAAASVRSLASPLLSLVALAPLFVATRGAAPRTALGLGWLAATVASFIGYAFVPPALAATGSISLPAAWAALAGFALFRGAWLGLAFGAAAFARGRQPMLVAALSITALEMWLPNPIPFAFGTPLVMWPPLAQVASVIGAGGLTLIAALFSAALAALATSEKKSWERDWRVIAVGIAAPTLATLFGLAQLSTIAPAAGELRATLIHTARDPQAPGALPAIPAGHDLVVLPESAIAEPLPEAESDALAVALVATPSLVLFGLSERAADGRRRNVALLIEPGAERPRGRYEKRALLPFAESTFEPGRPTDAITIAETPLSVAICSEELHADVIREGVKTRSAQAIVTLGNDAWVEQSFAPELHLIAAQARAIETNRSVLRASNAGITAAIDPRGRVIARTRTPGPLEVSVPLSSRSTPYLRFGNTPLCLLLAALALVAARRRAPPPA